LPQNLSSPAPPAQPTRTSRRASCAYVTKAWVRNVRPRPSNPPVRSPRMPAAPIVTEQRSQDLSAHRTALVLLARRAHA
ncbi:hypothetical protein H0H92_003737, partial [Tricholoma furcatifolium]